MSTGLLLHIQTEFNGLQDSKDKRHVDMSLGTWEVQAFNSMFASKLVRDSNQHVDSRDDLDWDPWHPEPLVENILSQKNRKLRVGFHHASE